MANDIRTPDKSENYSIRDTAPMDRKTPSAQPPPLQGPAPKDDSQPWNKSTMEIEPAQDSAEGSEPKGRYQDRIKVSPMNEKGAATKKAVRGWPEGQKKT
jgi:hypothetical protein